MCINVSAPDYNISTQALAALLCSNASFSPTYLLTRLKIISLTSSNLEVSNGILARRHSRSHIPVLHKTRPDHPPDTGNISLPERNTVASEVDGSERCAGQIGADEDALDVDGTAFELGGLEGDYDCGAVLLEGGVSAVIFVLFFSFLLETERSSVGISAHET